MATAIRASVTVSMAEETSGTRSVMWRVSRAVVSASLGRIVRMRGQQQDVVEGQRRRGELGLVGHVTFREGVRGHAPVY